MLFTVLVNTTKYENIHREASISIYCYGRKYSQNNFLKDCRLTIQEKQLAIPNANFF